MQIVRKNFTAKIDILESTPGPASPKQKVWRRDSPNYQAQNTVVAYRMFSHLDEVKAETGDVVVFTNWSRDGFDTPGPGAAFFPWQGDVPMIAPPNVTSVVVTVSNPSLVQIVPYTSVKTYCVDPFTFALYVKPGIPLTQYQDLGTVTVTITVAEGVTFSSPALPIASAEAYTGIPVAPTTLNGMVQSSPKRVSLTWIDGGGETSYEVQRQLNGGAWSTICTPAAGATSYSDTTVTSGAYRYQIRGINSYGNSTYAQSNVVGVS